MDKYDIEMWEMYILNIMVVNVLKNIGDKKMKRVDFSAEESRLTFKITGNLCFEYFRARYIFKLTELV